HPVTRGATHRRTAHNPNTPHRRRPRREPPKDTMQLPASGALSGAASGQSEAARPISRARSAYGTLVVFACVLTYVVITWGGMVRATGAGLACPDWPTCNGQLHPVAEKLVLIEWGHRFIAAILGFCIFATTIGAWKWFRRDRSVLIPATLASVFVVA